jgi:hypothetical protein
MVEVPSLRGIELGLSRLELIIFLFNLFHYCMPFTEG